MILGISGKIASGKTEVMKVLQQRGFFCISTDKIVHDLYRPRAVGAEVIAEVFGDNFLNKDGSVDRLKLRAEVFTHKNKLKLLNKAIHPLVYDEISGLLQKNVGRNIAIEATYFDEGFLADFVDKLIWVERPEAEILKTLTGERGFSLELATKVMNSISKDSKIDLILKNSGDLSFLSQNLHSLLV